MEHSDIINNIDQILLNNTQLTTQQRSALNHAQKRLHVGISREELIDIIKFLVSLMFIGKDN